MLSKFLYMILAIIAIVLILALEFALPTFIIFLILKLTGEIDWTWLQVCIPLIVGIICFILFIAIGAITDEDWEL